MREAIDIVAVLSVGALWGGMAFFAAIYAPLVFIKLDAAVAGQFIRQVFPVYYLAMGVTSAVAVAAIGTGSTHGGTDTAAMALVCAGFWFARHGLMPRINRSRDASRSGDAVAERRFQRLHRVSVLINGIQLIAVLVVLARFVWK